MPPPETCHAAGPVLMLPFQERPSAPLPSSALAFPMFPSQSRFIPEYPQRVALWGAPLPLLLGDGTLAVSLAVLLNPELPEGGDCVCTSLYPPAPLPRWAQQVPLRGVATLQCASHRMGGTEDTRKMSTRERAAPRRGQPAWRRSSGAGRGGSRQ